MATILAYTSPALGNLYPMCALLSALHERGHRIVLRTLARGVASGRRLGFDAAPIDECIESIEMTDWKATNGREALRVAFEVFGARAPLEVEDLGAAIIAEAPDALIVDPNTWGAAATAEASGLPWATFYPYTPLLRSPGAPPFGPGMRPWPGPAGRIRRPPVAPIGDECSQQGHARTGKRDPYLVGIGRDSVRGGVCASAATDAGRQREPFEYPGSQQSRTFFR